MPNRPGCEVTELKPSTFHLHKGHVGLLACSGMLNVFFGDGDMRHIAHWRSVKHVDEFNKEGETEGDHHS